MVLKTDEALPSASEDAEVDEQDKLPTTSARSFFQYSHELQTLRWSWRDYVGLDQIVDVRVVKPYMRRQSKRRASSTASYPSADIAASSASSADASAVDEGAACCADADASAVSSMERGGTGGGGGGGEGDAAPKPGQSHARHKSAHAPQRRALTRTFTATDLASSLADVATGKAATDLQSGVQKLRAKRDAVQLEHRDLVLQIRYHSALRGGRFIADGRSLRLQTLMLSSRDSDTLYCFHQGLTHALTEYHGTRPRLTTHQAKWIRNVFEAVDKRASGAVQLSSLPRVFAAANIYVPLTRALANSPPRVSLFDVQRRLIEILTAPKTPLRDLFDRYAPTGAMSIDEWMALCKAEQADENGELDVNEARAAFVAINRETLPPQLVRAAPKTPDGMPSLDMDTDGASGGATPAAALSADELLTPLTPIQFHALMVSPELNSAVSKKLAAPSADEFDHPMSDYWVASSHNSYLVDEDQLVGRSSTDMYRRILLQGCRSVELDVWDDADGEPVVTHGFTLCTKIKFRHCVTAIAECAFGTSTLPLSLSLEMHCSPRQQAKVAELLRSGLGEMLLLRADVPPNASPNSLRRRIIVKGKVAPLLPPGAAEEARSGRGSLARLRASVWRPWRAVSASGSAMDDSEEDELARQAVERVRAKPNGRAAQKFIKRLSLSHAVPHDPDADHERHASSASENEAEEADDADDAAEMNERGMLLRQGLDAHAPSGAKMSKSGRWSSKRLFGGNGHPKKGVERSLHDVITMEARSRDEFFAPTGAEYGSPNTLPITSLSERKMLSMLYETDADAALAPHSRHTGVAAMQRRTASRVCRVYPRSTRVASSNMDPLPCWCAGAQLVALNMQTNDLPVQLHYALFELGGCGGYVLKPPELRSSSLASRSASPVPVPGVSVTAHTAAPAACAASHLARAPSTLPVSPGDVSLSGRGRSGEGLGRPGRLCVHVLRAHELAAADKGGTSDPYAKVSIWVGKKEHRFKTKTISRTLDPEWNEEFSVESVLEPSDVRIAVALYDSDKGLLDADDKLGFADVTLRDMLMLGLERDGSWYAVPPLGIRPLGWQTVKAKGSLELRVSWCEPPPLIEGGPSAAGTADEPPRRVLPGYVLWPPVRETVRRVSIRLLALYNLPTRREARPKLVGGPRTAAHSYVPQLNGERAPPDGSVNPSSPSIQLSLHAIGGLCCVSSHSPPPEGASNTFCTPPAVANGLNATFGDQVHCFAAEPRETILKIAVMDGDVEVAYETVVLGILRPGYRCLQLRSTQFGTRIRLAALFLQIEMGQVPNGPHAQLRELRKQLAAQRAIIEEHERTIDEQKSLITKLQTSSGRRSAMVSDLRGAPQESKVARLWGGEDRQLGSGGGSRKSLLSSIGAVFTSRRSAATIDDQHVAATVLQATYRGHSYRQSMHGHG
jgi:hypothetical protein